MLLTRELLGVERARISQGDESLEFVDRGRGTRSAAASRGRGGRRAPFSGAYPFWSLGIFALCVIVIHGLFVYGEPVERA